MRLFFFFFISVALIACGSSEKPAPTASSLGAELSEEKMIDILSDIHLAEGFTQILPREQKDSMLYVKYYEIFQIHEVSQEKFEQNLSIYMSDPDFADVFYEKVVENIIKMETKARGGKPVGN